MQVTILPADSQLINKLYRANTIQASVVRKDYTLLGT